MSKRKGTEPQAKSSDTFSVVGVCSDILKFITQSKLENLPAESGSARWKGTAEGEVLVQKLLGDLLAKYLIEAPDRRETISVSRNLGAIMYQIIPKEYEGHKPGHTQTGGAIIEYLESLYPGIVVRQ